MTATPPRELRLPRWLLVWALLFPTTGAVSYFVVADPESPAFRVTYALAKVLQFALPVVYLAGWNRVALHVRCIFRGSLGGLCGGVATALLIVGVYALVKPHIAAFGPLRETVATKVQGFGLVSPVHYLAFAFFLAVLHAFLEEAYWRWFVFGGLRERTTRRGAILFSALGFAAHHVVVLAVYFPYDALLVGLFAMAVACGGAMWAWWYERTGSLAGAWFAHFGADIGIMAVGFDLLYR